MGYERNYKSMSTEAVTRVTMNKVYGWMCMGLVVSALAALTTVSVPALFNLIYGNPLSIIVLMCAELGLVFYVSARINSITFQTAAALMVIYAALNCIMLSSVLLIYEQRTIYVAFLCTAFTFGGMSAYGYLTKRDLMGMGSFLMMALLGVIIATLVNFFLDSAPLGYIITYAGLFIFVGLTAYDTQEIKRMLLMQDSTLVDTRKVALIGALNLYLDFVNMFLYILRLFGKR